MAKKKNNKKEKIQCVNCVYWIKDSMKNDKYLYKCAVLLDIVNNKCNKFKEKGN